MRSDFFYENLMNKHLSPAGKRASLFPGAEQTEKPLKRWLPRLKWKAAGFTGLSTDTTVSFAYAHLSHTTATHLSAIQCSFPIVHLGAGVTFLSHMFIDVPSEDGSVFPDA